MGQVDVTVMGAGVFGLSVAWACIGKGARVRIIDPNGVGNGASGGILGALAPHVPENWNSKKQFQLECLFEADAFWGAVEQGSGQDTGFGRTGRLQPVLDAHALDLARQRARNAETLWQGRATWRLIPAEDAGPWAPVSPTGWLIEDGLSARIHPRRATRALAAACAANGSSVEAGGTTQGAVVWATGYLGLRDMSSMLGKTVGTGIKGQAALLDHGTTDSPQLFADGIHIVPHADGTTAVGSTSERVFDAPETTDFQIDDLIARAVELVPALRDANVVERWAQVRPRAKSRAPMLGAWPGRPGHFVANGGFKIGFGMVPGVARVMADLICDGVDRIPPEFRVDASL
ncbi:MAG: FAD-binding oxidoreductase [Pseudomonadota bacterium]